MPDYGKHDLTGCFLPESEGPANSLSETGVPQWFAIAVKPRFDKAVARTLESKGFETLLPLYKKRQRYAGRSKESELPLFPGYVFCRFNVLTRLPILTTPGVTQILSTGNQPIPLSETEIVSLKTAIQAHRPLQPFPFLHVGQRVRGFRHPRLRCPAIRPDANSAGTLVLPGYSSSGPSSSCP